jgi:hypothetical protein
MCFAVNVKLLMILNNCRYIGLYTRSLNVCLYKVIIYMSLSNIYMTHWSRSVLFQKLIGPQPVKRFYTCLCNSSVFTVSSAQLVTILSQINSVHALNRISLRSILILWFPQRLFFQVFSFLQLFEPKTFIHLRSLPCVPCCSPISSFFISSP